MEHTPNRRPLKTRSQAWAGSVAGAMAGAGLSANQVSVLGIFFAVAGALAAGVSPAVSPELRPWLLFAAAATVQLRLLCNMLDGMIAVEHGKKSKVGDLFNEFPDRIEDTVLLLGAGYASGETAGVTLAWLASVLAMGTAYVRALGGSLGFKQDFCGPLAKPQRMFFLTVTYLSAGVEAWAGGTRHALVWGLALISAGTAATVVRRLLRLARNLNSR